MRKKITYSAKIYLPFTTNLALWHTSVIIKNEIKTVPALDELINDKEKEKQMIMEKKIVGLHQYTGRTFNLQKGRGTSGMPRGTWRMIGVCQAKKTNENSWQKSILEDTQDIWGYEIDSTRWRGARGVTGDIYRVYIIKGP